MRRFDNRKEYEVGRPNDKVGPLTRHLGATKPALGRWGGAGSLRLRSTKVPKTMFLKGAPVFSKNRRAKFAAFGALVTLGFIIFQGTGDAHNPEIAAKAECIVPTDQALITIDVVAWDRTEEIWKPRVP